MKRGLGICLVVALCALPSTHARAALLNGGFESGNFNNWAMTEDVYAQAWFGGTHVVTSHIAYTAYEGNYFAKMPVFSTVAQPVSWNAGDQLTFNWAFDGMNQTSAGRRKVASFRIYNAPTGGTPIYGEELDYSAQFFGGDTLTWQSKTYTFPTTVNGRIEFRMHWELDPGYGQDAYFYVDNVAVTPEPAALSLLLGLGAVATLARRRRPN